MFFKRVNGKCQIRFQKLVTLPNDRRFAKKENSTIHRILVTGLIINVVLGLWEVAEVKGAEADPFRLTVASVGPNNPRNSEAAIVRLKSGALLLGWTEFYAGSGADHGPARISGKVSTDGGRTGGENLELRMWNLGAMGADSSIDYLLFSIDYLIRRGGFRLRCRLWRDKSGFAESYAGTGGWVN